MRPYRRLIIDEDGDSPDWFELYNYGEEIISLEGWTVSDKDDKKMGISDISLGPKEYIVIWASGKDEVVLTHSRL